jgi:hypothetical protein
MISAHFTFSKHWFAISCTEFLFILPFGCYIRIWFFPSFAKCELAYFRTLTLFRIAHYMQKIWLCNIGRPCGPVVLSAATNWNYLLRRLILFQRKLSGILLIFYWHLRWRCKLNTHTHTHTHTHTPMTQQLRETSAAVYIHLKLACFTSCRTVCFGTLK